MSVIENGRAKFAFECAKEGANLSNPSEYKSYVKKIPMMIQTNGLAPALAFVFSKSNGTDSSSQAYKKIYTQIESWLKKDPKNYLSSVSSVASQANPGGKGNTAHPDFIQKIINMDSDTYRATTKEVLDFLAWLKRFAEGLIEKDKD